MFLFRIWHVNYPSFFLLHAHAQTFFHGVHECTLYYIYATNHGYIFNIIHVSMLFQFMLGCQNTPAKASRFCNEHGNLASTFQDDSSLMNSEGTVDEGNCDPTEILPMKILNDKETRNGKFYQVSDEVIINNN